MSKQYEKRCLAKGLTVKQEKAAQKLSPFELKNQLIQRANDAARSPELLFLNAGRGNPNFFNTLARKALCKLIYFALDVSSPKRERVPHLGFMPDPAEVTEERFLEYFREDHSAEAVFLKDAVEMAITTIDLDPDGLIRELTDAVRGDFYPDPPRIFPNIEKIVQRYLEQIMISDPKRKGRSFKVFATEGATAGMLYVFNSLKENFLLKAGDRVAVVTPVFSPYLEIPKLNDYQLELVQIDASEEAGWQLPKDQLEKLKDRSIKALYLINPTNPGAVALCSDTIAALADVVSNDNPGLIIIVDAVYSTFVRSYRSIIEVMPANCITVYSFSKYFGVTGWRLGAVMLYDHNVIDRRLLPALHSKEMDVLRERYRIVSEQPDSLTFMQRMVFDSREVALAHTGGLSCPQQVQMALFALFNLLHQDTYKPAVRSILRRRLRLLNDELMGLEVPEGSLHTHYYTLIDVLQLAERYAGRKRRKKNGGEFALFLVRYFYPVDFVFCLAVDQASVVLPGRGFFEDEPVDPKTVTPEDRNNWSIRVSLANLNDGDYTRLGKNVMATLKKFYKAYRRC